MALNQGLRRYLLRQRKARHGHWDRIRARLDLASLPTDKRAAVIDAYAGYMGAQDGESWRGWRANAGPAVLPRGVFEGPGVDWSDYDAAADYH